MSLVTTVATKSAEQDCRACLRGSGFVFGWYLRVLEKMYLERKTRANLQKKRAFHANEGV